MKIGSTAARISLVTSDLEALEVLAEANIEHVDFWLYLQSLDETYALWQDDWEQWTETIKKKSDELGLVISQCHALFNIFIPEDFLYIPPQKIIFRNFHACKILGCSKLVFHPLFYLKRVTSRDVHESILRYNLLWFRELLPIAEELGIEIDIENGFDFANIQQTGDIPFAFSTVEDVCWLVDKLNHPLVKVCFDTGHANISGLDVPEAVREIGKRLGAVHLQDNFGKIGPIEPDVHLFPGHGAIDWGAVMQALRDIKFQGVLNMEPVDALPRLPKALMVHHLNSGAVFLQKIAEINGLC